MSRSARHAALAPLALVVAALAATAAPRAAAAQSSSVSAHLTLVGRADPCISTGHLAGSHDVGATCSASTLKPHWGCPDLGPHRDKECKYIEPAWTAMDSVWGRVRASNKNGQLRTNADLVVETQLRRPNTPGASLGYHADAYAAWRDQLDLGTTPRADDIWVAFDLFVHGHQAIRAGSSTATNAINWDTRQRYTYNFDMTAEPWEPNSSDWYGQRELRSLGPDSLQRVKSGTLAATKTVWRKVGKNERFLSFAYNFRSEAQVPSAVAASAPENYYLWSRVTGDFGSTAGLTGVRFYDAGKTQQLSGVSYAFVNGTQFVTTTPEPGTGALLGTGLLAIGGVARRRRGDARG